MGERCRPIGDAGVAPAVLAVVVVALDQLSKAIVLATLGSERSDQAVALVGSFVALEYAENRGAAFGLFGERNAMLAVVAVAVLGGLALFYRRQVAPSAWLAAAVGLIAGGAFGNLVDRVRLGYVVDFVAVGPWPNFNVADSAITVGVALLVVVMLLEDPSRRRDGGQRRGGVRSP